MNELIKYFVNLLILQYRNKPRAKGTIEALARQTFADSTDKILPIEVQNSYNLDTAVGTQLDVIGKYLGYDRNLPFPINDNFVYAEYDGSINPDEGYAEYYEEKDTKPYLEYRYSSYDSLKVSDDTYRRILKMQSELKNKSLSLANIDEALKNNFDIPEGKVNSGEIYLVEGDKTIEYHISQDMFPTLNTQEKLNAFFEKYFPRPMGCSISVARTPYYLNLIPYGGAENGVDENFIYTGTADDVSKYFEMPYDIDIKNGDTVEINIKVKINGDYTLSGFYQIKDSAQLALLKRRIDGTITATGYGYTFALCEYADLVDEWITITLYNKPHQSTGLFGTVKMGDEIIAEDVSVPVIYNFTNRLQFAIANIGQISYYGFIGQMDFKECYIKKNNEYVWKGITNKRVQGV